MKKIIIVGMLLVNGLMFGLDLDHGLITGFDVGYNIYNLTMVTQGNKSYLNDFNDSISLKLITGYRVGELRFVGEYTNTCLQQKIDNYLPVQGRYKINISYTLGNFKIGGSHYCDHPVVANNKTRNIYKNECVRNIYVSYYREF